jgi:hypothetical protein
MLADFNFLFRVFEDASVLENLTGLAALHTAADEVDTEWVESDGEGSPLQ